MLIVGAGPVGLTLAIDLAWRGIDVTVVETRARAAPPEPKCNHVAARTMEIFRRLGIADKIRNAGLPADYPHDISYRTSFTGAELTRIRIPCRRDRFTATDAADCNWPTPEPPHRINQIFLEPILFEHAAAQPRIAIVNRTSVEDVVVEDESRERSPCAISTAAGCTRVECRFLIGCDGARSVVRKAIGAELSGDAIIQRVQSTFIRAPGLIDRQRHPSAWGTGAINPRRSGMVYAIDGRERWLVHNYLRPGEDDFEAVDRDGCLRTILGVDADFRYEIISKEDWYGRRLICEQIPRPLRLHRRRRRPYLGALCRLRHERRHCRRDEPVMAVGCASQRLGARTASSMPMRPSAGRSRARSRALRCRMRKPRSNGAARCHPRSRRKGRRGEAARREVGRLTYEINVQQYACAGLNFGAYYDRSPIIAYDGAAQPSYTMNSYTASTVPGCRTPHFFCEDGSSLYDAMGPEFTLLQVRSRSRRRRHYAMRRAKRACRSGFST